VPAWPLPDLRNFVHYYGHIKRRKGGGVVGWGENEICHSRRAFRFDGIFNFRDEPTGMYLPLGCAFRRFYCDGYAVGKFEVGLMPGEQPFTLTRQQTVALVNHLLDLPIRVPNPYGEMKKCRLAEAGAALAYLYAVGTTCRDYDIPTHIQKWWVSDGPPLLFLEYGPGQKVTPLRRAIPVAMPEKHGLTLSYYNCCESFPIWGCGRTARRRPVRLYASGYGGKCWLCW
jgi:hypothetical protein